ncbi:uncharacterized protein [Dysidea avara]|uniref:uncharacterized protein n=1 Tax=Dysidea avara TaxID=196820 RepID=UPI003332FE73
MKLHELLCTGEHCGNCFRTVNGRWKIDYSCWLRCQFREDIRAEESRTTQGIGSGTISLFYMQINTSCLGLSIVTIRMTQDFLPPNLYLFPTTKTDLLGGTV